MKILHLNSERGWRGGEVQTFLTAIGLARAGAEITVACPADSPLAQRLAEAAIPLLPLAQRGSFDLYSAWKLRRWLAQNPVDCLHAHTAHAHSVAALALAGRREALVVTRRVIFPLSRSWFTAWKYRRAVQVVAISQGVRAALLTGGVATERLTVIRDGIDVAAAASGTSGRFRQELALPAGALLVVCIAHLSADKDHATLLRAWHEVERALPNAHLALVGGGEGRDALRRLSQEKYLTRVHFSGFRSDIPDILADAEVVALTSRHEGLGSILMDAQACARPVVATAAGGIPEIMADGSAGLLAPVGDHAAVATHLVRLLGDADLRRRLGEAGRTRALAEFDVAHLVTAHLALYRRLFATA